FHFCDSTNQTATDELQATLDRLHEALAMGLELGQSLPMLTAKVQELFADPFRAQTIAMTEASRATHAGALLAAQDSGVASGSRWLASSDACPLGLALDGQETPLGQPFVVEGSGPYAAVYHPPRHPRCMCSVQDVLGVP